MAWREHLRGSPCSPVSSLFESESWLKQNVGKCMGSRESFGSDRHEGGQQD
jgi:hypothetical protein